MLHHIYKVNFNSNSIYIRDFDILTPTMMFFLTQLSSFIAKFQQN